MSRNVLILMSDQHARRVAGCYGDPYAETPHIDALAARGTRFTQARCNAPICVPSRASIATGLPIHEIPSWDNADPYHGQHRSFAHRARDGGAEAISIGKLHFRSTEDDTGFEEILPMHVVDGTGTFTSLLRDPMPRITAASVHICKAGPGRTDYTNYDEAIRDRAVRWLRERPADAKPFLLFVSFVNPHPPYTAPPDYYEQFLAKDIPLDAVATAPDHPAIAGLRRYFDLEKGFSEEQRRAATAAYYANVAFLDENIGAVLAALDEAEHADTTVLYTSDHGETLGRHGLWGKCSFYEDSLAVPLILADPGVPEASVNGSPAQLLDIYPTVLDALGVSRDERDQDRTGRSLIDLAQYPDENRLTLAQQHCAGVPSGVYVLTGPRWKYVHTVGAAPLLFDLVQDPDERRDLAQDPAHAGTLAAMECELRERIDPEAVNAAAFASQSGRLAAAGGRDVILHGRPLRAHTPVPRP